MVPPELSCPIGRRDRMRGNKKGPLHSGEQAGGRVCALAHPGAPLERTRLRVLMLTASDAFMPYYYALG